MYLYKKASPFQGSYSIKLCYCYSKNEKKEIEIKICNEEEVPKEINEKCIYSGTDIYFFNNYSSNQNEKYFVLSNYIYNLINSDLEDFLSKEDKMF